MAARQGLRPRAHARRRQRAWTPALPPARRAGDAPGISLVLQLRSRRAVCDTGRAPRLSRRARIRGGGPRPPSRWSSLSLTGDLREPCPPHQPVPRRVAARGLPLRLHVPRPSVARRSRYPLRRLHLRHRPVRAPALRREDDLPVLRRPPRGQAVRRASLHAAAGFHAVPAAEREWHRRVEAQARLDRRPRWTRPGQRPSRLHGFRRPPARLGVSGDAVRAVSRAGEPLVSGSILASAAPRRRHPRYDRQLRARRERSLIVYAIDPLRDPRWAELVARHPKASVFHTPGWLLALQH